MNERKYTLRRGIEGIIPPVFGESFRYFENFSERVKRLPKEAYLPWESAIDFFNDLLNTSDNDEEKYMLKTYLLPCSYHGIGKTSISDRDYKVANQFMIVSFNLEKRTMSMQTMRQSEIGEKINFSASTGKYVLLLKEEDPETIPQKS